MEAKRRKQPEMGQIILTNMLTNMLEADILTYYSSFFLS